MKNDLSLITSIIAFLNGHTGKSPAQTLHAVISHLLFTFAVAALLAYNYLLSRLADVSIPGINVD